MHSLPLPSSSPLAIHYRLLLQRQARQMHHSPHHHSYRHLYNEITISDHSIFVPSAIRMHMYTNTFTAELR